MTTMLREERHALRSAVAAGFALALLLLPAGCKKADDAPAAPEVTVSAEHPEAGPIVEHIQADAILSPLAQAAISPRITAPVRRFYVQRGSHVKAGQLLATLENRDLQAAALDSRGTYTAAQAAYLTETKAQVPEDFQKAQLDVAQTKATLDLNQSIVRDRQNLFTQGAIPGRDLDTAQAALVQAQAAYDSAAKHFESLRNVSRQAALQQAAGQLDSAKGKYLGAEAQVAFSEIRSPISGVVTDRALFAGETAAAGASLLTVMDTSSMLAKVHLAQSLAQRMKLGDAARVTVPGVAEPAPATVLLISPSLDPGSTTVEVWLKLDNRQGALKAGTPVRVMIEGQRIASALKIPAAAVLTAQDGSRSVMVAGSDGAAHRRPVKLGLQDGEDVQVTEGLAASDTVVTTGAYGLDDGARIKIGAPEAEGADGAEKKPSAGKSGSDE